MRKTLFLFLFLFLLDVAYGEEDLCRYFKYCGGSSSHHTQSLPSSTAAAGLNPANISSVKGFGIETTYQVHNPLTFDFVTGNGKMGALVSPTLENSFFSNRSIEIDELFYLRMRDKIQYENKKLSFSLGAKLIDKKNIGLDFGTSVKRNPDIKQLNFGVGLSARLGILHFGAYSYRDDVKIDLGNYVNPYTNIPYAWTYRATTYQEKFAVDTYTGGAQIQNFSFDVGVIKTHYKFYSENTRVNLYSSSYAYKNFLFSLAIRKEYSPNLELVANAMVVQRKKSHLYLRTEYLVNRFIVLGLQHNNFLLNEWSSTLTLFF